MQTCITGSIISVNVGQPRLITLGNNTVATSIFKYPVETTVAVREHNLEGDRQADLRVHGGPYKAVYLYPSEHYPFWKKQLGDSAELSFGAFGENLTTLGFTEEDVYIGDRFRAGTAIIQITQPRMPCFKLNLRFGRADMVKRFWLSVRPGIYFSIVQAGELTKGDVIEKIAEGPERITVAEVVRLYSGEEWNSELHARALRSPLRGSWKRDIESRLTERQS